MEGDQIAYVSQAAQPRQGVKLIANGHEVCGADILIENHDHVEEKLYIGLSKDNVSKLPKSIVEGSVVCVKFVLKYTYFNNLIKSVRSLSKNTIQRLMLTEPRSIQLAELTEHQSVDQYRRLCSPDQFEALKMITLTSFDSEPVVTIGPFGTGKTRILALASHYLFRRPQKSRILVCTHQRASADTFLETFLDLKSQLPLTTFESRGMPIVFLIRDYGYHSRKLDNFYRDSESVKGYFLHLDPKERNMNYLLVTTCLTAPHLKQTLDGFFTHIMIDEGAQMREPEAIAPLCMSDNKTRIVITGDPHQVT